MFLQVSYHPSNRSTIPDSMSAAAGIETRETGETASCSGRPEGHSFEASELTTVLAELGDLGMDGATIWDYLSEGRTLTIRCVECCCPLRVSLQVVALP